MACVCKSFGATRALDGVELEVWPGEIHALVGENGAGKSTLMKVLSGAVPPDRGEMFLDGVRYAPRHPAEGRRQGVAMIYQELSLAPQLSVLDNLLLGIEPTRWGMLRSGEARRRAAEALARVGHGELRLERRVGSLSAGARQLVEIARALLTRCRVLVLDEPTSSLTAADVERLFALMAQLKAEGLALVYISHFLDEVKQVADRYTVLRDGKSVDSGRVAATSVGEMARLMAGREIKDFFPRSARSPGDVVLQARDVAGVVRPLSAGFALRRGEVLGVAGLVGAGRTELLRVLQGLDPIRRGHIRLGVYQGWAPAAVRLRQGMGMVSEDRKSEGLALGMSLADNMTLSRIGGLGPAGLILPARQAAAARRWIDQLGIRCRGPWQTCAELSGGNQQKVALARLLHHDVDVLLLDEPTRGIDVGSKAEIYRLIDQLALQGKAILLVSGYLPELLGVCDRVAVMCRGVLGPARSVEELDERTLMLEAAGSAGEAA